MPTKKNWYRPPVCHDERLRYVKVDCGKCYECKKKKARDWKIRISETLRKHPSAIFFTGTFTDERIEYLCEKYGIDKENVNEIATKEVRLFLERCRQSKKDKKSIKHWIVTEKGHTNTRRIHIHGIFWADNKASLSYTLKKEWTAGYSYQGKYVNEKTVNYIVKYMTKTDLDNPDFTGIVLASPGLGKEYLERTDVNRNKYKPYVNKNNKTNETYIFRNGQRAMLPKYLKEKIYDEDTRQILWIEKMEEGISYVMGEKVDTSTKEGEEAYEQLKNYYRIVCKSVHKDNPAMWAEQSETRKRIKKANYREKERRDRKEYYRKNEKRINKAQKALERDIKRYYMEYMT
uniref:Replication initiator protein n=1 Tax=Dulem virus 201 TaxID=3145678 RepID=A0AAU8B030_9VIRU